MRQTTYTCDWCKADALKVSMRAINITGLDQLIPRLAVEICSTCEKKLEELIQRIAVRAQDMHDLEARP